jgi:hypothetical protein
VADNPGQDVSEGVDPPGSAKTSGAVLDARSADAVGKAAEDHLRVDDPLWGRLYQKIPRDDMQFPAMCRWTYENGDT